MDERMKILELLENGKISAEDAAKLLEAVSRTRPTPPRPGFHSEVLEDVMGGVSGIMDSIPSIIRESTRLGGRGGKKTLSVKKKPKVRLSMVGGDVALSPSEDENIRGNLSSGLVTARDAKEELWIKCLGGDALVQLPRIEFLFVSAVGGDIRGELDCDGLVVKTLEGDISLSLTTLKNATLKSKSGDIELSIPEDADACIDLYTMSGDIVFEPQVEAEEKTDNRLKGKMGEGTGSLTVVNLSGDITVKKRTTG